MREDFCMNRRTMMALLGALTLAAWSATASADPPVSIVHSQFTDRIERSRPVGDASAIAGAGGRAIYWVEVNNPGQPVTLTFVWRVDGHEVRRQTMEVGRAPRWRTWVMHRVGSARSVEVQVLGPDGAQIHTDTAALAGT
jgi:hypothetical protein